MLWARIGKWKAAAGSSSAFVNLCTIQSFRTQREAQLKAGGKAVSLSTLLQTAYTILPHKVYDEQVKK